MSDHPTDNNLTPALAELLATLRASPEVSITITHLRGVWTVKRAETRFSSFAEHQAATFEEAWDGARAGGLPRWAHLRVVDEGDGSDG